MEIDQNDLYTLLVAAFFAGRASTANIDHHTGVLFRDLEHRNRDLMLGDLPVDLVNEFNRAMEEM